MSTIQELFQQALLAEAAYANFSAPGASPYSALIAEGFSDKQATDFLTQWEVVDQYTASGSFGSSDTRGNLRDRPRFNFRTPPTPPVPPSSYLFR